MKIKSSNGVAIQEKIGTAWHITRIKNVRVKSPEMNQGTISQSADINNAEKPLNTS